MKLIIEQEFPCGYKMKLNVRTYRNVDMSGFKFGECPIHGNKCKREAQKNEIS